MPDTKPARHAKADAALEEWQRRLLPFMVRALIALGAIFFVASLWHYATLQQQFDPPNVELREDLKRLETSAATMTPEYRDWYVRAVLEETAMKRRYQQTSVVVQTRAWTRLMGFLTGMVLVFSGCIFILGKLREDVNFSGDVQGAKWALITSSPGVVLAVSGAALIALSIYVPTTVESSDSSVYLPVYARTAPAAAPPPAAMSPAPPASNVSTPPALPPDVQELLRLESAKINADKPK